MKSKAQLQLRQQLAEKVIESMLPFVKGWITTLGQNGSPRHKGVSAQTRVAAAKTGIELVSKFLGASGSATGDSLLKQLAALDQPPPHDDEEDPEYEVESDGSPLPDWPEDPDVGSQEADLE